MTQNNSSSDISIHNRLGELDALRGIAAMLVVLFHCSMFRPESDLGFFLGVTGVDLFFIISGFVIFMSLEKSKSATDFIIARFIRLFPIYWIMATLTFLLYYFLHRANSPVPFTEIPFSDYLVNLSMIQYYFNVPNLSGSYWTLVIELLFYTTILVFFITKTLKYILVLGLIMCALILLSDLLVDDVIWKKGADYFPLIYHFPLFLIGILFFKMYSLRINNFLALLLILILALLQVYLAPFGRALEFTGYYWYASMLVLYIMLFLLFVSGYIKFIVNRITRFLGEISYSLYLIHQPICYCIVIPYFVDFLGWSFWIAAFGLALPLSLIVAALVTYYIEIPLRINLKKKWLHR